VDEGLTWAATETIKEGAGLGLNRLFDRLIICFLSSAAAEEEESGEHHEDNEDYDTDDEADDSTDGESFSIAGGNFAEHARWWRMYGNEIYTSKGICRMDCLIDTE
jgi:hypothetical protein